VPRKKAGVTPNQVFVGLPWKNVRSRYETCIDYLEKRYPLHFTIVGRKDAQDADDLLSVIKERIQSSSYGVFDATNGNANVSLEYGYAEAIELPRAIYVSTHKASNTSTSGIIISDLGGKRRVEYKNEASLKARLETFCKSHDYTKRFDAFMQKRVRARRPGERKRVRTLVLKLIHQLDGKKKMRRADLVQALQAQGYAEKEINAVLKKLHTHGLLKVTQGRYADVLVA
jgi:hypothetical protein